MPPALILASRSAAHASASAFVGGLASFGMVPHLCRGLRGATDRVERGRPACGDEPSKFVGRDVERLALVEVVRVTKDQCPSLPRRYRGITPSSYFVAARF